MKTGPDWTDLSYFCAIARTGGLARAAAETGVSTATLSRRMKAFEADIGRRLFVHGAQNYTLTPEGRALYAQTQTMQQTAERITRWRDAGRGPVPVRISAGTWTALDLAEGLRAYWAPGAIWLPEFMHCDLDLDIARREVDIGVRNRRPEQPWVARRRIGTVDYAVFGAHADVTDWIGPSWDTALTPSVRWVQDNHADAVVTKANTPHLAAALARAGIGKVVLPLFVARRMTGLVRLSDPIAALRSEQWLVSHHDARDEPPIRAALDAIAGYLGDRD